MPTGPGAPHPAFGEHPVLRVAGWPWNGIEGSGLGQACDAVPFGMGVDALLVNFVAWFAAAALLLGRMSRQRQVDLVPVAAWFACFLGLLGGFELVRLFD